MFGYAMWPFILDKGQDNFFKSRIMCDNYFFFLSWENRSMGKGLGTLAATRWTTQQIDGLCCSTLNLPQVVPVEIPQQQHYIPRYLCHSFHVKKPTGSVWCLPSKKRSKATSASLYPWKCAAQDVQYMFPRHYSTRKVNNNVRHIDDVAGRIFHDALLDQFPFFTIHNIKPWWRRWWIVFVWRKKVQYS